MRKLCSYLLVLVLVWFCTVTPSVRLMAVAQVPILKNPDVLRMLESGLSPDVVVAKIKVSPVDFDTSPDALAELKKANVPEAVLLEMVRRSAAPAGVTEAKPGVEVNVPDGTEVEIALVNTASGEELKVGNIVDFTVNHDVVVDGVTVFKRDAPARAKITTAKKAGRWGRAGKLEWAMEDIQAADGNRVPARFTKRLIGDSKGGTVAVAAVATTIFLGPLGLFWGLKKGKPAIIPAGNRYSVFVHGNAKLTGKPAS
jgi:hypothetical protein